MGKERSHDKSEDDKKRRLTLRNLWRLGLLVIGVIAIAQELQKPPKKRTWHGKVGDLVPYDFRVPTAERLRAAYWNTDGPFLPGKAFGVGWAVNFGALRRLIAG